MTESALGKNLLALITESHLAGCDCGRATLTHPKTTINVSTRIKIVSLLTTENFFPTTKCCEDYIENTLFFLFCAIINQVFCRLNYALVSETAAKSNKH